MVTNPSTAIERLECRIAPAFGVLNVALLNGGNGFRLESGLHNDEFGRSASIIGDINGDGFDDFAVGAPGIEYGYSVHHTTGSVYVVFGKATGFPKDINVSSLNGTNGFRLAGAPHDLAGIVSGAGDVNGDGFDDLMIGAPGGYTGGFSEYYGRSHSPRAGRCYVVYGKATSFTSEINLPALNGSDGFKIVGTPGEPFALHVSSAGDFNGDGFDDIVFREAYSDEAFVLFGKAQRPAKFTLSQVGEQGGFSLRGLGRIVPSGAGDLNADGFSDIAVALPDKQETYVIFGNSKPYQQSSLDFRDLDGANGFRIHGAGNSVSGAGDVNGDGFEDLIIGSTARDQINPPSAAYIVYGKQTDFDPDVTLNDLDGNAGVRLRSNLEGRGYLDTDVEGLGDFNGDGVSDMAVSINGSVYVLFGRTGGLASDVVLENLNGSDGFKVAGDYSYSLGGKGDINGDGFSDIVVGATPTAYVVFGGPGNGHFTGPKSARFFDTDGDVVTVRLSQGKITDSEFSTDEGGILGGERFLGLALSDPSFTGAKVIISARPSHLGGDGSVDLGFLNARGIDLRSVSVDGDLGRIEVGDDDFQSPAIMSVHVRSIGALGDVAAGSYVYGSIGITGSQSVGGLHVSGSIRDSAIHVRGDLAHFTVGQNIENSLITVRGDYITHNKSDAQTISNLYVGGDVSDSRLLVGFNASAIPVNPSVHVGTVRIDGDWIASDLSVGVRSGQDGKFGTADDRTIAGSNIYGATVDLTKLNGVDGFRMDQLTPYDELGRSVSGAGDINGDGLDDFILGVPGANHGKGSVYVVFGTNAVFPPVLDLSAVDGINGFRIDGEIEYGKAGFSVHGAGDVNGDGLDDLVIGATESNFGVPGTGNVYVVFGHPGEFSAVLPLRELNGSDGFRINGTEEIGGFGRSVNTAGDINGDGFDDLIVASYSPANGYSTFVIFGRGAFSTPLELSSLDGTAGFRVGGADSPRLGYAVSSAGDVNGDGFDDLLIGSNSFFGPDVPGAAYVVFGKGEAFAASFDLSKLDGRNGFRLSGGGEDDLAGFSVSAAGDINRDGFADVLIGAPYAGDGGQYSGAAYVVFGKSSGFSKSVALGQLSGSDGFEIVGTKPFEHLGRSVSGAGDVNGDGADDILVGAPNSGGTAYVVFGKAGAFSPKLHLSVLTPEHGFQLQARFDYNVDPSQVQTASSGIGDLNGDGFDDVIVRFGLGSESSAYVVFGNSHPVPGSDEVLPNLTSEIPDMREVPIHSRIAAVIIQGRAIGTNDPTDHFGIVAEEIANLSIGASVVPLRRGPSNDSVDRDGNSDGYYLASTLDMTAREAIVL